MLKLTTKRKKWFTVPQDPSGETRVEIQHLKPGEVAQIEAKSNQIVGKQFGDEDFMTEIGFNFYDRNKRYAIASITDWEGFQNASGIALKCTEKNILSVLDEYEWFAKFIEDSREFLKEEVEAEMEGAEKNSKTSVSG